MLRHVAAGVDGSRESLAAADWAARESARRRTPLKLVHAWEWQPRPPVTVPADETQRDWAARLLRQAKEEIVAAHPDLEITADQVSGPPVTVLLKAAEEAELLVLGSRGFSAVGGFVLGSVSLRVIAGTNRPVVLVRSGHTADREYEPEPSGRPGAAAPHRPVVIGLSLRHPCDEVLEFAFDAAERRDAALHAVHTWDYPPVYGYAAGIPDPLLDAELRAGEEHVLSATLQPWRAKFPGVEVTEHVIAGRPGHHLAEAASRAGLLVVGRRIREPAAGPHIGPVTHAVIHHVAAPVAVVPHR